MKNRYAVGLYSVRDELKKDLWGTLRKMKAMGYDGVEFYGGFRHTAQEVKAALDEANLVCCGWHTGWDFLNEDNFIATVTYNKVLGNAEIVIPGIPAEMMNSKAACLDTAKKFSEMAAKLATYGMKLAYHNHGVEFKPLEGDLPIHYIFDNSCPSVGLQFDNGNAWTAGPDTDVYAPVTRYPYRIRTIHHKPFSLKDGYATMLGEDDIDWSRFFKLCRDHQNIEWHIIEYEHEKYGQFEGIEKCIKALRKMELEGKI